VQRDAPATHGCPHAAVPFDTGVLACAMYWQSAGCNPSAVSSEARVPEGGIVAGSAAALHAAHKPA